MQRACEPDGRRTAAASCHAGYRGAAAIGTSVLLWLAPVSAQPPPELVLQNLAPEPRTELAAVVVPFAPGQAPGTPPWHVADRPTAWEPFGARWPDGSIRQALCLFPIDLAGLQELRLPLVAGAPEPLPDAPVPMPNATVTLVVRQGQRTVRVVPPRLADLEANPLRRVELRAARLGDTGLVAELLVTAARDQAHAALDVAVFHSDPRAKAFACRIDELAVECEGMAFVVHHAGRFGVRQAANDTGSRTVLLRDTQLGDGQGIRRGGALLPPPRGDGGPGDRTARAAARVPLLGATDWRSSGAFGAFGVVPDLPPWLAADGARAHLAERHRRFVAGDTPGGDPFAAGPLGLAKAAGQTGDQYDFGTVKLSLCAATGLPSLLFEAEASVRQESLRPVHFFEVDGTPVRPEDHPDWIVWSGRTHWHPEVSPDRLGKPVPEPPFDSHGWTGKDREHWSSNHLGAYALLTGAHWARRELANEARLYRAGQTLDPQRSTSGAGPPRAAGRTQHAATWIYLATGDEALRERIDARIDLVEYPQWAGRERPADQVRPFAIASPDARMLGGKVDYWTPWQEGIAAVGFAAVHRTTGNPRARELAEALAKNLVQHGWLVTDRECLVATALAHTTPAPLTPEAHRDPTKALWSYGTAFSEWALPAVEIARVAAERTGDTATAERAATIQRRIRATRQPPPRDLPYLGGIDRLTEWDALRWH